MKINTYVQDCSWQFQLCLLYEYLCFANTLVMPEYFGRDALQKWATISHSFYKLLPVFIVTRLYIFSKLNYQVEIYSKCWNEMVEIEQKSTWNWNEFQFLPTAAPSKLVANWKMCLNLVTETVASKKKKSLWLFCALPFLFLPPLYVLFITSNSLQQNYIVPNLLPQ